MTCRYAGGGTALVETIVTVDDKATALLEYNE